MFWLYLAIFGLSAFALGLIVGMMFGAFLSIGFERSPDQPWA